MKNQKNGIQTPWITELDSATGFLGGDGSFFSVDADTGRYQAFSPTEGETGPGRSGSDFFAEVLEHLARMVCEDDRASLMQLLQKENFVRALESQSFLNVHCRLLVDGVPVGYCLRGVQLPGLKSGKLLVSLGKELPEGPSGSAGAELAVPGEAGPPGDAAGCEDYARMAKALAQDYFRIYCVNTQTGAFQAYRSLQGRSLQLDEAGEHFFDQVQKDIPRLVFAPDCEKAIKTWDRDFLLGELERFHSFSTTYRLLLDDKPTYVNAKAVLMREDEGTFLVIGVSGIDSQIRQEEEFAHAREMSMRDTLTGVKNSRSYAQTEQELNEQIACSMASDFAVVVCDIVDLKRINESHGHVAGDQFILEACGIVCRTFSHSPVFRIAGDVFVALLRNGDYERRSELMSLMDQLSYENQMSGKVTIASGIAEYRRGQDVTVGQVFERAEGRMNRNKKAQKTRM